MQRVHAYEFTIMHMCASAVSGEPECILELELGVPLGFSSDNMYTEPAHYCIYIYIYPHVCDAISLSSLGNLYLLFVRAIAFVQFWLFIPSLP